MSHTLIARVHPCIANTHLLLLEDYCINCGTLIYWYIDVDSVGTDTTICCFAGAAVCVLDLLGTWLDAAEAMAKQIRRKSIPLAHATIIFVLEQFMGQHETRDLDKLLLKPLHDLSWSCAPATHMAKMLEFADLWKGFIEKHLMKCCHHLPRRRVSTPAMHRGSSTSRGWPAATLLTKLVLWFARPSASCAKWKIPPISWMPRSGSWENQAKSWSSERLWKWWTNFRRVLLHLLFPRLRHRLLVFVLMQMTFLISRTCWWFVLTAKPQLRSHIKWTATRQHLHVSSKQTHQQATLAKVMAGLESEPRHVLTCSCSLRAMILWRPKKSEMWRQTSFKLLGEAEAEDAWSDLLRNDVLLRFLLGQSKLQRAASHQLHQLQLWKPLRLESTLSSKSSSAWWTRCTAKPTASRGSSARRQGYSVLMQTQLPMFMIDVLIDVFTY